MPEVLGDLQYSVKVETRDLDRALAENDRKIELSRKQWERPFNLSFSVSDGRSGSSGGNGRSTGRSNDALSRVRDAVATDELRSSRDVVDANRRLVASINAKADRLARTVAFSPGGGGVAEYAEFSAKVAQGDGEDDAVPTRPRSRGGLLGGNGLGRLATAGFAIREALNVVQKYQQYEKDMALAGGDMRAQTEAVLSARDQLFNIPFVGQALGILHSGEDIPIRRTLAASDAEDEGTSAMADYGKTVTNASRKSYVAKAIDQYDRSRREAEMSRDQEDQGAVESRNVYLGKLRVQFRKEAAASVDDRDPRVLAALKPGPPAGFISPDVTLPERLAEARDSVISQIVNSRIAEVSPKIDAKMNRVDASNAAVFDFDKARADRAETAENIASRTGIEVSRIRRSNPFGAELLESAGLGAAKVADAEVGEQPRVRAEADADFASKFSDMAKDSLVAFDQLRVGAIKTAAALSRDPRRVAAIEIDAEREQQLRSPLANVPILGRLYRLGVDYRAKQEKELSDQQFNDQTALIDNGLDTQKQQLAAGLRRDRVGAEVAGIVGEGKGQALTLEHSARSKEAKESIQNSIGSLQLLKQNYMDAFRGTQVDLRTMDVTNPRDSENPNQILGEIQKGIDDLNTTLKNLTS